LTILRADDAVEADAFGVVAAVLDFNGIAVEDGDDGAGEVGSEGDRTQAEKEAKTSNDC
jgi:hypothetical protein